MPDELDKMDDAANDIADCIGNTLAKYSRELLAKYEVAEPHLAVAILRGLTTVVASTALGTLASQQSLALSSDELNLRIKTLSVELAEFLLALLRPNAQDSAQLPPSSP